MGQHICYLGNAVSIHTQRWVNYFAENGWKVDLITWRRPDKDSKLHPNITVYKTAFPPHYFARYFCLIEIALIIKRIHPDIIHAHYIGHFGILAGLYGLFTGFRPIVLTAWGSDLLKDAVGLKRSLIKIALNNADCITCDAEHMKDALLNFGVVSQKIVIIYFGTDTQKFSPHQDNGAIRNELGLIDSPVVISLRNLEIVYDIATLIKAIPFVLEKKPAVKFLIAGRGSQEENLKGLSKELGIFNSIRFLHFIKNDELPQFLRSADVYVSTSLSDAGLAASTAEAMACGLPVIITDFGDNKKWIQDGINGFIVPMKDPNALAKKIVGLLDDPNLRNAFGKKSRELIEEKNSYCKEMNKMESIYRKLIERYS